MSLDLKKIENSPEFKQLISTRWTIALILTFLVFITYYGFVLLAGVSKATLAYKIGEVTTLGIPIAVGVIVVSFILTLIYVFWANEKYDKMVASILKKAEKN